jgi:hypothetical protein
MSEQLACPNCSAAIPPERINMQEMAAACPECAHVFRFASLLPEALPQIAKPKLPVTLPKGFEVRRELSALYVEIPWRAVRRKWFITIFAILWGLFMIPFVAMAVSENSGIGALISLHLAAAVGLTFYVLALWLNTTKIRADNVGVEIRNTPIPIPFMPRRLAIPATQISQLYVEEYVASYSNRRPNIAFALRCKLKNGKHIQLVPGFTDASGALYLEQEIEKFLKITDRPA